MLRAQQESLNFTDREIMAGLFSSFSCHCLFNSERWFPHSLTRLDDILDPVYPDDHVTIYALQTLRVDNKLSVYVFNMHPISHQENLLADIFRCII